ALSQVEKSFDGIHFPCGSPHFCFIVQRDGQLPLGWKILMFAEKRRANGEGLVQWEFQNLAHILRVEFTADVLGDVLQRGNVPEFLAHCCRHIWPWRLHAPWDTSRYL